MALNRNGGINFTTYVLIDAQHNGCYINSVREATRNNCSGPWRINRMSIIGESMNYDNFDDFVEQHHMLWCPATGTLTIQFKPYQQPVLDARDLEVINTMLAHEPAGERTATLPEDWQL